MIPCEIARQLFEMLDAVKSEQKIPLEFESGLTLYRAEIDLLEMIGEYPGANVSMLSAKSGVSRSAVTQIGAKLADKGLIERYQAEGNKKERYFRLTDTGRSVRAEYAVQNQEAADKLYQYLCTLDKEEKKTILSFMERIRSCIPVGAFPCRCKSKNNVCFMKDQTERTGEPCWN